MVGMLGLLLRAKGWADDRSGHKFVGSDVVRFWMVTAPTSFFSGREFHMSTSDNPSEWLFMYRWGLARSMLQAAGLTGVGLLMVAIVSLHPSVPFSWVVSPVLFLVAFAALAWFAVCWVRGKKRPLGISTVPVEAPDKLDSQLEGLWKYMNEQQKMRVHEDLLRAYWDSDPEITPPLMQNALESVLDEYYVEVYGEPVRVEDPYPED